MSVDVKEVIRKWEEVSANALDVARALENDNPVDLAMGLVHHVILEQVAVRLTKAYAEDKTKEL